MEGNRSGNMEEELGIIDLFKILYKNILYIILFIVLGIITAVVYCCFLMEEEYESKATIILTIFREGETVEYDFNNSLIIIKTVSELPKQSIILEKVSVKFGMDMKELAKAISVNNPSSSLVLEIKCRADTDEKAMLLTNTIVDTLIEECATNPELAMIGNSLLKTSTAQKGTYVGVNKIFIGVAIVIVFAVLGGVLAIIVEILSKNRRMNRKDFINISNQLENI